VDPCRSGMEDSFMWRRESFLLNADSLSS
jgi:hypothetical protein